MTLDGGSLALGLALGVLAGGALAFGLGFLKGMARAHETHALATKLALDGVGRTFERVVSVQTIGAPEPTPGELVSIPTPEERATHAAQEAAIARGVEYMREAYRGLGVERTDDELRGEVLDMIGGKSPEPPSDLRAFLRDG